MENDSNKKDESNINEFEIYNNLERMFRRYELSYIQFDINFFHSKEYKSIYYNFKDKGIGFYFRLYKELFSNNNELNYDVNQLINFDIIKKNEVGLLNYIIELDLFSVNAANNLYSKKLFENLYVMKKSVAAREVNRLNGNKLNIKYSLKSCVEILKEYQQIGNFIVLTGKDKDTGEIYNKFVCPNDYFDGKPKINLLTGEIGDNTSNKLLTGTVENNINNTIDEDEVNDNILKNAREIDKRLADKFSNDEVNEDEYYREF